MKFSTKENKNLREERSKVTMNIEEFSSWYHGGAVQLQEKRFLGESSQDQMLSLLAKFDLWLENEFSSDSDLQTVDMSYLSHKDKYEEAIKRATLVMQKIKKLQSEGRGGNDIHR